MKPDYETTYGYLLCRKVGTMRRPNATVDVAGGGHQHPDQTWKISRGMYDPLQTERFHHSNKQCNADYLIPVILPQERNIITDWYLPNAEYSSCRSRWQACISYDTEGKRVYLWAHSAQ